MNRDAIVSRVTDGTAKPTRQLISRDWFGSTPSLPPPTYDPTRARALLAEAGFPTGFNLTIHCSNNRHLNKERICRAISQMPPCIGIQTTVQALPFAAWIAEASRQDYSMIFGRSGIDTAEASPALGSLFATYDRATGQGASNRSRYSNPEVDRPVSEGLAARDDEQRRQIFIRATEIAMRDVGLVPTHHQVHLRDVRREFTHAARSDEWTLARRLRPTIRQRMH